MLVSLTNDGLLSQKEKEKCLWYKSPVWFSHFAQDECLLEPELYERAEKLFRVLLRYVTDFLVWEETLELSAELQPRYGLSDQMQIHKSICKALNLTLTVSSSIHAGQKKMHTTVCCTMMSTTRTTMWSTPCSALLTVMRLKRRHTQHLLTKRYFLVLLVFSFTILSCQRAADSNLFP